MEEKNIVVEDVDQESSEEADENVVEMPEAEDELTLAQKDAEMYKDRWMRLAAEFENYKKRTAREFEALIQSASED
ncbi:MAG: nucleotide exchange factor GrpE, partial [Candidatus Latescibacterota bacterium]